MIVCNTKGVEIRASLVESISDMANVICSVHKFWAKHLSEDAADKLLAMVGRLAMADEEHERELSAEITKIMIDGADDFFEVNGIEGEDVYGKEVN